MLAKVGHANDDQLLEITSRNRLKTLRRKKILKKVKTLTEQGETKISYKLRKEGKKILQKEKYVPIFYSARSPEHDTLLAEKYISLTEEERESWSTEQENKGYIKHFDSKYMSTPDASYVKNGERVYIEAITRHYSKAQIEEKMVFAKASNAKIEILKS